MTEFDRLKRQKNEMIKERTEELVAMAHDFAMQAGICERSPDFHAKQPCEECQGLVNFARAAAHLVGYRRHDTRRKQPTSESPS